jgi:hypothetical protein
MLLAWSKSEDACHTHIRTHAPTAGHCYWAVVLCTLHNVSLTLSAVGSPAGLSLSLPSSSSTSAMAPLPPCAEQTAIHTPHKHQQTTEAGMVSCWCDGLHKLLVWPGGWL